MKFRTDFVTNSSDSSFLAFNIKNKKLFDALTALGIKIKNVEEGEFTESMVIVLPSGKRVTIREEAQVEFFRLAPSITEWLLEHVLLGEPMNFTLDVEFDDDDEEGEEEDYDEETEFEELEAVGAELEEIISKATLDGTQGSFREFFRRFGDDALESATIEQGFGFEAETSLNAVEANNGKRMTMYYKAYESEKQSCDHLTFVVTGKLEYFENREEIVDYIEEAGGTVSESVSKNTDYLICNDINSNSIEMKTAQELGVTLLTEAAFIRRFGDPTEFDLIDDESLSDNSFKCTMNGDIMDFLIDNGACPIIMEVWQNGRWVRPAFRKKNR